MQSDTSQKNTLLDLGPVEVVTVDARAVFDNYYFLVRDKASGRTAAIDCGGAAPVLAAMTEFGWAVDEIWVTHHHWDHVNGLADLKAATGAPILGCPDLSPNMPDLDVDLPLEGAYAFAGHDVRILHVPGHADGHIAFYIPAAKALFCGDSLMVLGCGRLLEGTAAQMWESLTRLAALPGDTVVFSGHEYAYGNAQFSRTIEPGNHALQTRIKDIEAARAENRPTVPSLLSEELETNPFLRAGLPEVKAQLDMADAPDHLVFAEIRQRKDNF